jgi:SAM-dependent methyltransferase
MPMLRSAIARARRLLGNPLAMTQDQNSPNNVRPSSNDLRRFFDARKEGRGIWKWNHYFDIYERYFSRFRGTEVRVLEIGIYSGGSLEMWKSYFGPKCQIYGVDIEPSCKACEGDSVRVFIGDQADRNFWKRLRNEVDALDIVIDDGGHQAEQQIVSLEELLPLLRPGGVYLCEDVTGSSNPFTTYVFDMAKQLNAYTSEASENPERRLVSQATALQSAIRSIHLYPYVTVIERTEAPVVELVAPKRGTSWEPFLK